MNVNISFFLGGHHGSGHDNENDHTDEDSEELPYTVVENYGVSRNQNFNTFFPGILD